MKRFWISLSILVLVLLASVANSWYLDRVTGEIALTLTDAQRYAEAGDWEQAQALTSRAEQRWEDSSGYLYIFLRHSDTDTVQTGFREIKELLQWQEEAEYASSNAELVANIRMLAEMEQFNLRNLL